MSSIVAVATPPDDVGEGSTTNALINPRSTQAGGSSHAERLAPPAERDTVDGVTRHAFVEACLSNNLSAVRAILDSRLPVDGRMYGGQTALHIAAQNGSVELLQLLLARG
ncbi:MAG: ankyrin repeat domain-containing protein, partial [Verrucomicrobia bacterium]|nr:ankyrin repeat domain-containing protein [Verrucomicrobiota bacterium]